MRKWHGNKKVKIYSFHFTQWRFKRDNKWIKKSRNEMQIDFIDKSISFAKPEMPTNNILCKFARLKIQIQFYLHFISTIFYQFVISLESPSSKMK